MKQTLNRWLSCGVLCALCSIPALGQHYTQTNLASDTGADGTIKDANLVNPWGMSRSSGSPWWLSDNGTNLSTLYTGTGSIVPLVVSVPGGPTGTVYNGTKDFPLAGKPSVFLFSTEGGTILGWNGGAAATVVASKADAVYKGLARATIDGANYLYATDFRHGKVDVLDAKFKYVSLESLADDGYSRHERPFSLNDRCLDDFAPFNIQNIGGNLFVTFAKQDAAKHDEVDGSGLGFVAVFTPKGHLIRTFEHGSWLNAPWALAESPDDFGSFSHALLVGNFGNGEIAAYNLETGHFLGLFEDETGKKISIPGLWGLSFGNDAKAGNATVLYFTAGPNSENNGLFGTLVPEASDLTDGNSN